MTPAEKWGPALDGVAEAIWSSCDPAMTWPDLKQLAESGEELGTQLTFNNIRHQASVAVIAAVEILAREGVA